MEARAKREQLAEIAGGLNTSKETPAELGTAWAAPGGGRGDQDHLREVEGDDDVTTANERIVLRAIVENEYHDRRDPINDPVWSDCLHCSIQGKALSGVVSSLSQKGLVTCSGEGRDATVAVTQEGYDESLKAEGR